MANSSAGQLIDVLKSVRAALNAGDFEALKDHAVSQELLSEKIRTLASPEMHNPDDLRKISRLAQQNEKLLEAAREGLRSIHRRRAEIRSAKENMQTYDTSGTRNKLRSAPNNSIEKRS